MQIVNNASYSTNLDQTFKEHAEWADFLGPELPPLFSSLYPTVMVLILGGNSEHVTHACRKIGLF